MDVYKAVENHLRYHKSKSKKNTDKTYEFVLLKFSATFSGKALEAIAQDDALDFLVKITNGNKQTTKRNRYSTLSSFYNFTPELTDHCSAPVIKKIFRRPLCIQWKIFDKDTIDEIILRTTKVRNRVMLELMARGGMRIGEVLKLTPNDIDDRKLIIKIRRVSVPKKSFIFRENYCNV